MVVTLDCLKVRPAARWKTKGSGRSITRRPFHLGDSGNAFVGSLRPGTEATDGADAIAYLPADIQEQEHELLPTQPMASPHPQPECEPSSGLSQLFTHIPVGLNSRRHMPSGPAMRRRKGSGRRTQLRSFTLNLTLPVVEEVPQERQSGGTITPFQQSPLQQESQLTASKSFHPFFLSGSTPIEGVPEWMPQQAASASDQSVGNDMVTVSIASGATTATPSGSPLQFTPMEGVPERMTAMRPRRVAAPQPATETKAKRVLKPKTPFYVTPCEGIPEKCFDFLQPRPAPAAAAVTPMRKEKERLQLLASLRDQVQQSAYAEDMANTDHTGPRALMLSPAASPCWGDPTGNLMQSPATFPTRTLMLSPTGAPTAAGVSPSEAKQRGKPQHEQHSVDNDEDCGGGDYHGASPEWDMEDPQELDQDAGAHADGYDSENDAPPPELNDYDPACYHDEDGLSGDFGDAGAADEHADTADGHAGEHAGDRADDQAAWGDENAEPHYQAQQGADGDADADGVGGSKGGDKSKNAGERLRKMFRNRKSLAGNGTIVEEGKRHTTRNHQRPLEYWRNEHKVYGRAHRSLPTVVGVCTHPPEPDWPAPVHAYVEAAKTKRRARTK